MVISIYGGSGSGKTTLATALQQYFLNDGRGCYLLSGDDYPHRIPKRNDEEQLRVYKEAGEDGLRGYLGTKKEIDFARINEVLAAWAKEIVEKKISTVNMLGCHDGIPLLDLKGLLPKEEIQSLIDRIVSRGDMVKNLHGQKNLYYQVNATYYSAFVILYVNFESGTYTILESR